jgi:hypothetical protein
MWPAIASFLLGIVGWLVASFVGTPFLDFLKLRGKVHEELIFTGNMGEINAGKPEHEKARDSLRRLGAKVQATNVSATPPLRWFFGVLGYDLVEGGSKFDRVIERARQESRYLLSLRRFDPGRSETSARRLTREVRRGGLAGLLGREILAGSRVLSDSCVRTRRDKLTGFCSQLSLITLWRMPNNGRRWRCVTLRQAPSHSIKQTP